MLCPNYHGKNIAHLLSFQQLSVLKLASEVHIAVL